MRGLRDSTEGHGCIWGQKDMVVYGDRGTGQCDMVV